MVLIIEERSERCITMNMKINREYGQREHNINKQIVGREGNLPSYRTNSVLTKIK